MSIHIAAFLLMVAVIKSGSSMDPCISPSAFTNLFQRSSTNVRGLTTTPLSDRFITEEWYGQPNFKIPNSPPGINHCGTVYPIYLQGADPVAGPEMLRTFCVQTGAGACAQTIQIETKLCSNFLAYKLKRPSLGYAAYCVDEISGTYPDYVTSVNVVILPLDDVNNNNEFEFVCNFQTSTLPAHNNIWYTVTWYVNNQLIKTVGAFQNTANVQVVTVLLENEIIASGTQTVGFQIRCGYAVSNTAVSTTSPVTSSKDRFIGIEILTPIVYVNDGDDATITVRPTAPIGCSFFFPTCQLEVNLLKVTNNDDCALSPTFSQCGFPIDAGANWDNNYNIIVRGNLPSSYSNLVANYIVTLKTVEVFPSHQFWGNYTIGAVTVVVSHNTTSITGKMCYAVCDPHMKTFYGRPYEHQYGGIYTLYENAEWKQEIQIYTMPCTSRINIYCVCGVAIRVGREVWRREQCTDSFWKTGYAQCDGPSRIDVQQYGSNQHKIRLPSSTTIRLYTSGNFLNVYVYPSVAEKGKVRGLCGQITTDQFIGRDNSVSTYWRYGMPQFSASWRVYGSLLNLFSDLHIATLMGAGSNLFLCKCDDTTPTSILCTNSQECQPQEIYTYTPITGCQANFIKKRSVRNRYRVPRSAGPEHVHISKRQAAVWRNGWTERSATDYCTSLFQNSSAVQICNNSVGTDIQGPLDNCVLDIKLLGDTSFALVAVETVKTSCFHEVSYDTSYQQSTTNQSSIFDQIKEVACPAECSHHGTCNKGVCTCDEGYGGLDCSVSLNTPPTIVYEYENNLCNSTNGTCKEVNLLGGEFVNSTTLCCIIKIYLTRDGRLFLIIEIRVKAIFVNSGEIVCPRDLNKERGYTRPGLNYSYGVCVSNNGKVFSKEILFDHRNTTVPPTTTTTTTTRLPRK
ncbi:von Willebrand factor D and EGF domain-containing protein isoform X1 [Patella vulgata]|uniref:von Willebrand factor D and EGF domain-containing protein isoform X1 n=1 Tax=Patella vulgata TaxID=6465 RepID=UPI0024A9A4FA|nr:von Willebrand factor D and EGF domain-containing protein isoform X1 [Patella vulgata]